VRALVCDDYQGVDALRVGELPDPVPGPGDLLVEIRSAAVNFADTLMVAGSYQTRPETPFAPGFEVSGIVADANGVEGFERGDRICGFAWHGGMAELAVVPGAQAAPLPEGIDFDVGAVLPATYGTSFHALVDRARIAPGETLLVLGAAAGVGLAALQIGKALGATVVAAVSTEEKAGLVEQAGADHVIRYDQVALRDGIAEATDGRGIDVVFDPVGGDATEQALRSTRWNGRHLVIGFAAGPIPQVPLNIPLLKGNALVGVFWGRFTTEEPVKARQNLNEIIGWALDGTITPVIQRAFTLDEGREAFQWVAGRKSLGRVVVNP
jgi:NADPH2:quinone reductase